MKYFVDSSYIVALIKQDDSLHEKSLEFLDLLDSNDCYINKFIINEVITVIGNKINLGTASAAYNLLNSTFNIIDDCSIKDFNYKTMIYYEKFDTKLSFTDCSIITCMESENIKNLISFDNEFKKVNFINLINWNIY